MPLLRLIAEGVEPFERLDVDLSDGKGNPHLGPHIFAGVNGSGKSTVLRALAWAMDVAGSGFPYEEWEHMLNRNARPGVLAVVKPDGSAPFAQGSHRAPDAKFWAKEASVALNLGGQRPRETVLDEHRSQGMEQCSWTSADESSPGLQIPVAAYSSSKTLKHLAAVDLTKRLSSPEENCLAFEGTVQNEIVQSWLLGLYSKRAIARDRQQESIQYTRILGNFENALRLLYDTSVSFEVEIEPNLQPRLRVFGRSLDFSQLPDGVRSTVGWLADFMMRQDLTAGHLRFKGKRPGVLLLDEVDAHLHPLWQRKLLPAMREALPDVQILVTSHSPFVISSCPGSRVHVLELDKDGRAHARPPVDAPIGESVTTTLKDIFGVDSRFDVLTERQLDE